jgi:hypothetical protein
MASPFSIFRKNQRVWMAILVFVAVVSFVIIPSTGTLMNNYGAPEGQQTLVSWKGTRLTGEQLAKQTAIQAQSYAVFSRLAAEVVAAGGTPRVPGYAPGPQGGIGLEPPAGRGGLVQLKTLAEAAREHGVVVNDETVDLFIRNFTDGKISSKKFEEIVQEVAGKQLSKFDMYSYLKDEISKQLLVQMGVSGITSASQPLVSPSKNWLNFQKLQQRAKVEIYPIFVDQFVEKVTAKPSESELKALYEKAKDLYSIPSQPEPGFRRRYKADFEYLFADFNVLIKEEQAKITPEQLEAEYKKRVEAGSYKVPVAELKPTENAPVAETKPVDGTTPEPAEKPAEKTAEPKSEAAPETKSDSSAAPEPKTDAKIELPADKALDSIIASPQSPTTAPATNNPSPANPSPAPPVAEPTPSAPAATTPSPAPASPAPASPAPASPAPSTPPTPGEGGKSSQAKSKSSIRLVAFQAEPAAAPAVVDAAKTVESTATEAVKGTDEASTKTVPEEKTAEKPMTETKADPVATTEEPAVVKTADEAAPATTPANPAEETKPTASTTAADATAPTSADPTATPAAPEKPMRVQTLDEVRESLLREMSLPGARTRAQEMVEKVSMKMSDYGAKRDMFEQQDQRLKAIPQPEPLDLKTLASETGMTYGRTGMVDNIGVNALSIGQSYLQLSNPGPNGSPFASFPEYALMEPRGEAGLRPFQVQIAQSLSAETSGSYVFWKVESEPSRVPTFEEAREEITTFWKQSRAQELALKAAEEMAAKLNAISDKSTNPWTEVLESHLQPLVITPSPFTWLLPMMSGGEGAQLSSVDGVDLPGQAFMEKVFTGPVGQAVVAFDAPRKKSFVIRIVERLPNDDDLKIQFERSPLNRGVSSLANQQSVNLVRGWFASLLDSMGLETRQLEGLE